MTKYIQSVEWTPLSMPDEILKQLPDCQFYTSQYDVLKNDADILHARLQSLEKPTKMTQWKGNLSIVLYKRGNCAAFIYIVSGCFHGQIMFNDVMQARFGCKPFKQSALYVDDYIEQMRGYV